MSGGGYSLPLNENVQIAMNASGNATLTIGPQNVYQVWQISGISVSTSTANSVASCSVYQGSGPNGQFLGGTYNASQNSGSFGITLYPGQTICAVFTGGDPGSVATMAVIGTVNVP